MAAPEPITSAVRIETAEVKTEVVFLFQILRLIQNGIIRIPDFQRRFVWNRAQMLELLDSIRLQFPIGNILLWNTMEQLSSSQYVGPLKLPAPPKTGLIGYVLDGQQRLSTLFGVLQLPMEGSRKEDDKDPGRWKIYFNASLNSFEHLKEKEQEAHHFPMNKLMDTLEFIKESSRMLLADPTNGPEWIRKLEILARTFQSFKLPLISIETNLGQAVEIFARLNSKGQPISADQMYSALTYTEDQSGNTLFNLAEHIDHLQELLEDRDFREMDRTILLRACLAVADEDVYKKDLTKDRNALRDKLNATRKDAEEALIRAVDFLHELGIHTDRLLPYSMQLVVLAAFFRKKPHPTSDQNALLRRWFWVSSYTGWFGSGNPSRVAAMIREFSNTISKIDSPSTLQTMNLEEAALPFPADFDLRSARTRVFLLALMELEPRNVRGETITEPWRILADQGPSALGNLFATVTSSRELVFTPANRIIRPEKSDRSQASKWLQDVSLENRKAVFESHGLPEDAFDLLALGSTEDKEKCLQLRQRRLIEKELEIMKRERVTIPRDLTPLSSPIDTE